MGNKTEVPVEKKQVKQSELQTYVMIVQQKLLQLKSKAQADISKKKGEIKTYFKQNNIEGAKLKMETIMREEEYMAAYEILSFQAETMKEKVSYIMFNERCPDDIRGTVDTMIYASSRVNMTEFQKLREMIGLKYGDQFISEANANVMGLVNVNIIQKLSIKPVSEGAIMARLKLLNNEENCGYEFSETFEPIGLQGSGQNFNAEKNSFNPNFNQVETNKDNMFPSFNQGNIGFSNNFNQSNFNEQSNFNQQPNFNQQSNFNPTSNLSVQSSISKGNDIGGYPQVNDFQSYPQIGNNQFQGNVNQMPNVQSNFQPQVNSSDFPNTFNPDMFFPEPKK